MDRPSRRAPGYDLFKLIVAMILLILFLLLNWRGRSQSLILFSTLAPANPTTVPVSLTPVLLATTSALIHTSTATGITSTLPPAPSPINTFTPIATPLPSLVATPATTSTAAAPVASACEAASLRSRLQNGMNATILQRLNFRSSPGIRDNWLRTNLPGTQVEIIGGPECLPHASGAYVWWQIKLPDGQIGWSAEASQYGSFYFMEPAE